MSTYRLFPATSGPATPVTYAGNFLAGVQFKVTQGGMWFQGYWWWVCNSGQSTSAQKFALWAMTAAGTGTLVPGSVVTSGPLTAGQWNFVALSSPIPLSIGVPYNAATGFTGSFPDSDITGAGTGAADSYGAGGHTGGITNGPLFAYSDTGQSSPSPYGSNGLFSTAGSDPSVNMPNGGSNSGNFWMDLAVSDTAPVGYSGSYRLWPNNFNADSATTADSSVNYVVASEVRLSQNCAVSKIWYFSPPGTAQLATSADIWRISDQANLATVPAPSWSGAAGSGWVSAALTGVTLPAGSYRVSVYNGAAVPDGWSAKRLSYWGIDGAPAVAPSGITNGPLFAPPTASASTAWEYNGSAPGSTPPYTTGVQESGQSVFAMGPPNRFPYLYVTGLFQNYWVDLEVAPQALIVSGTLVLAAAGSLTAAQLRAPQLNSQALGGSAANSNNLGGTAQLCH